MPLTDEAVRDALAYEFTSRDLRRNITIAGYFRELLLTLWREEEGFSGKRPFGNSSWQSELIRPLSELGHLTAEYDENGWLEEWDGPLDAIAIQLIQSLGGTTDADPR